MGGQIPASCLLITTCTPRQTHVSLHTLTKDTSSFKGQHENDYPSVTGMKNRQHQVPARMWNYGRSSHLLLREMQMGLASSENCSAVLPYDIYINKKNAIPKIHPSKKPMHKCSERPYSLFCQTGNNPSFYQFMNGYTNSSILT